MKRIGQTRIEWALLGVIAVVCAVLSFLQYRWTGELSRAEPALLRAGLNEQLRRLSQSFSDEIRENCSAILPTANEILQHGFEEAHKLRYQEWVASHDRSWFARIGIAARDQGRQEAPRGVGARHAGERAPRSFSTVALYGMNTNGQVSAMDWPAVWEPMRPAMTSRINGTGRPPAAPQDSSIVQMPVFSADGSEAEWMIFELNEDYLRSKVLPRLVAEYLNPGTEPVYDVSVSWNPGHGPVVFSTRGDHASVAPGADATLAIFGPETGSAGGRGRSGRGHDEGRGREEGRGHDEGRIPRWTIAARHRAGSLDIAVAHARTRNLIASLILVGLLGGTAWALVRYTARTRRLAEMQFRFAVGVSHDLRTPLTAIRGAAFNLSEGVVNEPEAIERYGKLILRNAEELTSMIENVLAFSASLRSGAAERREAFAIGDIVEHAAGVMTPEIEQAGCRLEVNVAPELPAVVGDPVALELVFRNLIGNAVRHGAGGKWIGVSAARSQDGVEVRVCDHGPGIPEAERDRIFEPYYRGEQTRVQRVQGTGLGLSLVKNTIERHNGAIEVNNSPGGGAEFTVRLPAVPAA